MSNKKIARRLRRLKKKQEIKEEKPTLPESLFEQIVAEKDLRKETTNLALKEVGNFRQKHKRYPKEEEFDEIAESIYGQLKESYREEARGKAEKIVEKKPAEEKESFLERRRKRREEEVPEKKGKGRERRRRMVEEEEKEREFVREEQLLKPAEEKELSIEGLFERGGKEEEKKEEELSLPELAESEEITPLEEDLKLITDDTEAVDKELETEKNKCPTCGSKTENIIFCPECGSGFCTHCAKRIEVLEDKIKYVCPKCNNEFKVKKLGTR